MVLKLELGEVGVGIATSITYFFNMAITDTALRLNTQRFGDMIFWYDAQSFMNFGPYLSLATQGMILLCAETSVYDILNIVAGVFSVHEAAA